MGMKVTDFNLSKQKNPYLDNYLTESHWQAYMDPRIAAEPKLMSMALLMHALGCVSPKESQNFDAERARQATREFFAENEARGVAQGATSTTS